MQTIGPLRIGQNIKEVLDCDLAAEYDAQKLYTEAREVCHEHKDYVSMQLFESLLSDEEDHINFIEAQLRLIDSIGIQNYGQLQAASADKADIKAE